MSKNHRLGKPGQESPGTSANGSHADPQWERMVLELLACSDDPTEDLDEMAAARYLAGQSSAAERAAIDQCPELTDCVESAQEVLRDMESAA